MIPWRASPGISADSGDGARAEGSGGRRSAIPSIMKGRGGDGAASGSIAERGNGRIYGGYEAPDKEGGFFGVVQPAGAAGGTGGLRAGARMHDRAPVRLGALGEHHGGAGPAIQGDGTRERGVSAADSAELHREGKVACGGVFAGAGGGDARRGRKAGRAAGDPADIGNDHRARVCEVDSVVPRFAGADQSVEQRGALGAADKAVPADAGIFLAGRPYGARDGGRGGDSRDSRQKIGGGAFCRRERDVFDRSHDGRREGAASGNVAQSGAKFRAGVRDSVFG